MVKYLKPGQDFGPEHFSADFGFSSSRHGASGGDDGTYVGRQRAARVKRAEGGKASAAPKSQPGDHADFPANAQEAREWDKALQGMAWDNEVSGRGYNPFPDATPGPVGKARGGRIRRADGGGISPEELRDAYARSQAQYDRMTPAERQQQTESVIAPRRNGQMLDRLAEKHGGRIHRAVGGAIPGGAPRGALNGTASPLDRATITMPVGDAARSVETMMQLGANMGARRALMMADRGIRAERPDMARPGAATSVAAAPRPPVPHQGVPPALVAKGGFIKNAVQHPGRMKRGAAREGVSTHEYMEEHKDASGSLGQAARLGLRLTGGDLSPRKRKG